MGGLHDLAGVRRVSWGGDGGGARDRPADAAARWRHVVQGASQQTVQERVWNGPAIPAQRLPAPNASCGPGARSGPAMAWPSDRVRRWCGAPGDGMSHSGTGTRIRRDHQRAGRPEHPLRLPGGHDQRPSLLQHVR